MSQNETQKPYSKGLSVRSVLFLVLIVGVAAGATAYAIGNVFAAAANTFGTTQQSTDPTSSTAITAHNCTLASLGQTLT